MFGTGKLHNVIVNNGLTDDEYKSIRDEVVKSNRNSMTLASLIAIAGTTLMTILSLCGAVEWPWLLFAICDAVSIICLGLNRFIRNKNPSLLKYVIYLLTFNLMALGILLGTIFDAQRNTAPFIAILILMPLLFTDRCYRECLTIFLMMVIFLTMAVIFNKPETWLRDFLNVCIFGTISMLVTYHLAKMKVASFYREYLVSYMANRDPLTCLHNRAKYEKDLEIIPKLSCETITCIYSDLNCLHIINNTEGHAKGDEALKCVANAISDECKSEYVYRTGGDEFVIFITDISLTNIEEIISNIKTKVKDKGYSTSIGFMQVEMKDLDINKLLSDSEHLMYNDKIKYYKENNLPLRNEDRS